MFRGFVIKTKSMGKTHEFKSFEYKKWTKLKKDAKIDQKTCHNYYNDKAKIVRYSKYVK